MAEVNYTQKYFKNVVDTPDYLKKTDIESIKDWLNKQPHLPQISTQEISIFLHSCYGALELTKTTIDTYFTMRTHAPELFNGRTYEEVEKCIKVMCIIQLPQLMLDDCRIIMLAFQDKDPAMFDFAAYLRTLLCMLDLIYLESDYKNDFRLVYDMTGASIGHLVKFSVPMMKKLFVYLQELERNELARSDLKKCVLILPEIATNHGLFMIGIRDFDANKFCLPAAVKEVLSLIDIAIHAQPYYSGWRIVINVKGFSFGHFTKLTTSMNIIKKVIYYIQDGLPIRLKGIHVFNAIPLINQFLALVKPLMKKELYDLIHIHSVSDMESLFEFVPKECLPSDYGGNAGSIDQLAGDTLEKMKKYQQWFVEDEKFGRVDESKRTGKAKNSGDVFGIEGSFKKLDLD